MADISRLNGVIRALEAGKPAFTSFCQADPETAIAMSTAKYDGVVYEMEHNPWDIRALRDSLQYMLNRGQISKSASVAPAVVPMVRIPPNGAEKAQFQGKQRLLRCSNGWRGLSTPARSTTWWWATRTSMRAMSSASSAKAIAFSWRRPCAAMPPSTRGSSSQEGRNRGHKTACQRSDDDRPRRI